MDTGYIHEPRCLCVIHPIHFPFSISLKHCTLSALVHIEQLPIYCVRWKISVLHYIFFLKRCDLKLDKSKIRNNEHPIEKYIFHVSYKSLPLIYTCVYESLNKIILNTFLCVPIYNISLLFRFRYKQSINKEPFGIFTVSLQHNNQRRGHVVF